MELTAENFDKLLKKSTSLESAISEERGNQKELKKQLEEANNQLQAFLTKQKEEEEKEAKKKGKYEELLKEKEEQIKQLQEKATQWELFQKSKEEQLQTKYDELTKRLPEEAVKEYSDIMDSLDLEKKVSFLERLATKSKTPDFGVPPKQNGESGSGFQLLTTEQFSKLQPDARKDYFKKSKEIHGEVKFNIVT